MNEHGKNGELKAGSRLTVLISRILTHSSIVLAGALFVLFIIDGINKGEMGFLANPLTKWLLAVLCGITIINAISHLDSLRKLSAIQKYLKLSRRSEDEDE